MTNKRSKTNEPPVATAADDEPLAKKAKLHDPSVAAAVVAATSDGKAEGSPTSLGAASGAPAKKAKLNDPSVAPAVVAATSDGKAEGSPTSLGAASGAHATSPVDGGGAGADFTTPIKTHRAVAASADLKANGTQDGIGASSGVPETATAGRLDTITKDSPAPASIRADGDQCSACCRPPAANAIQLRYSELGCSS